MEHILSTHWEDDHGKEWPIKVYFDYQPVEKQTRDDPGCDSDVTINDVTADFGFGIDSCKYLLNEKELDGYRMECFAMMEAAEDER